MKWAEHLACLSLLFIFVGKGLTMIITDVYHTKWRVWGILWHTSIRNKVKVCENEGGSGGGDNISKVVQNISWMVPFYNILNGSIDPTSKIVAHIMGDLFQGLKKILFTPLNYLSYHFFLVLRHLYFFTFFFFFSTHDF